MPNRQDLSDPPVRCNAKLDEVRRIVVRHTAEYSAIQMLPLPPPAQRQIKNLTVEVIHLIVSHIDAGHIPSRKRPRSERPIRVVEHAMLSEKRIEDRRTVTSRVNIRNARPAMRVDQNRLFRRHRSPAKEILI